MQTKYRWGIRSLNSILPSTDLQNCECLNDYNRYRRYRGGKRVRVLCQKVFDPGKVKDIYRNEFLRLNLADVRDTVTAGCRKCLVQTFPGSQLEWHIDMPHSRATERCLYIIIRGVCSTLRRFGRIYIYCWAYELNCETSMKFVHNPRLFCEVLQYHIFSNACSISSKRKSHVQSIFEKTARRLI